MTPEQEAVADTLALVAIVGAIVSGALFLASDKLWLSLSIGLAAGTATAVIKDQTS